ncbi:hypothetical protein J2S64_003754 [Paeniglutamicibacter sulfureus]|uniref:Uncharacterized protein n=1 Tax=Paeniglutamicibacter sulfureus TaxID=43666 RepID=A0ABU2BN48_9MICC|nr:hypothetical protein [Paeniglutamicibacter sulfureus]
MYNRAYYVTRAAVRLILGTTATGLALVLLHLPAALLVPAMT